MSTNGFWKNLFPLDIAQSLGFHANFDGHLMVVEVVRSWTSRQNPALADPNLPKLETWPSLWAGPASVDAVHVACWVQRWELTLPHWRSSINRVNREYQGIPLDQAVISVSWNGISSVVHCSAESASASVWGLHEEEVPQGRLPLHWILQSQASDTKKNMPKLWTSPHARSDPFSRIY